MSLSHIHPEQLADLWTRRVTGRMTLMGIQEGEIQETTNILKSFLKTGIELLLKEPVIQIPKESLAAIQPPQSGLDVMDMFIQPAPVPLDPEKLNQLIELFIRSVNQMSKQLLNRGYAWEDRKWILEQAAWETFNMAKVLIGLYHTENSKIRALDTTEMLLQEMVKRGTDEILNKYLSAVPVREGG